MSVMTVRRSLGLLLSGVALLGSMALVVGCESGDRAASNPRDRATTAEEPPCDVGAERKRAGIGSGRPAVIIGCGQTSTGREVQLYSWKDTGGPCIFIAGLPGGTRACGRAPSERVPPARAAIGGSAIVRRSPGAPLELYGETAPDVGRVMLRYRPPGGPRAQSQATLIRIDDRSALRTAGISQPFGYFVGTVPPRAKQVVAVAYDRSRKGLGSFTFDRLAAGMHPTVFIATRR